MECSERWIRCVGECGVDQGGSLMQDAASQLPVVFILNPDF